MKNKIKTIIVEDEYLARDLLKRYLSNHDDLIVIDECENGFQAVKSINELKPDLIFLDIQLPKINGFEVLELLDYKPQIIFTTAYDEYAVKAFELNAIDYLLKPFSKERFDGAIKKTITQIGHHAPTLANLKNQVAKEKVLDKIVVKSNNNVFVIPLNEVTYIESEDDYVMVHSAKGKHLQYQTMSYYEEHLDAAIFIRIHRSFIVNIHYITKIEKFGKETYQVVLKDGTGLKVSRSRYQELKDILGF